MVCPGPLAKRALPCVCTQVLAGIHLPSSQARVQAQQHTPYVSLQVRGTSNHMRAAAIGFCLAPGYAYNTIQQGQAHLNKHTTDTHPLAQPPQNTVDRHKRRRGTCCCEPALLRLVSTKQRASQAPGPHVKTSVGLCAVAPSAAHVTRHLRATAERNCVQQTRALACNSREHVHVHLMSPHSGPAHAARRHPPHMPWLVGAAADKPTQHTCRANSHQHTSKALACCSWPASKARMRQRQPQCCHSNCTRALLHALVTGTDTPSTNLTHITHTQRIRATSSMQPCQCCS